MKMTKDQLREEIIELNYYITQAAITQDVNNLEKLRLELNKLIELYKKELLK